MKRERLMNDFADAGLRKLRKDVGTGYRWVKKKFQLRKIKKMRVAEAERDLKFKW